MLVSRASHRIYIQSQVNVDDRMNYEIFATTNGGKQIPKPPERAFERGGHLQVPHQTSIVSVVFSPGQQRVEKFALSGLVQIPSSGGEFQLKIGRGLFAQRSDPFKLDQSQILWCKPIEISFPPLK